MTRRARQLELAGMAPAEKRVTAKKDLSEAAFKRAIARLGFRQIATAQFVDERLVIDAVTRSDPVRIRRRATIAKLKRSTRRSEPGPPAPTGASSPARATRSRVTQDCRRAGGSHERREETMSRIFVSGMSVRSGQGSMAGYVRIDLTENGEIVASHQVDPRRIASLIEKLQKTLQAAPPDWRSR